tara:strand:+ start:216 stop:788 length:573 start_codon:yes stop_codon:yes gene_type:complete
MKIFLSVLILILSLQSWARSDVVNDFEMEGMSIGDSLLDFFSKSEIKKNNMNYYKKKKFITIGFNNSPFLETYDWLQITYESKDKNYTIVNLDGVLSFKKNHKDCLIKKDKISKDIENTLNEKPDKYEGKHPADRSGKSIFETSEWNVDGGKIIIQCIDWSKKMEQQFFDHLKVWIGTNDYFEWMHNNPY